MIIPGRTAITRGIIKGLLNAELQAQPCGVDLSLRHVSRWTSAGTIDFGNQFRQTAATAGIPFIGQPEQIHLPSGNYLVEFNETIDMPLDIMGQVFVRSSLWRSGALIHAGVMDSGYTGVMGAMLQVMNPRGLTLHKDARLAQMVFHHMSESVRGYDGVYQGSKGL